MMHGLSNRQSQTLDFIRKFIEERGVPPTLREIGNAMGIRSTNGVNDHLRALERKGFLRKTEMISRGLQLVNDEPSSERTPAGDDTVDVKIVGRIVPGLPLLSDENIVDTVRIDRLLVRGGRDVFGFRMAGDSMVEAGILAGDYLFIQKQPSASRSDVVVALIGDGPVVMHFYPERDYLRFQPANTRMAPVLVRTSDWRSTLMIGKVVGVWRRL